ncbi:FHA domain-containing protein [Streptomyces kronopolitis]|uniref:FHA domain-containing protein n=1 Tax=Streptomyces kronopolitis TaxID=1612435 RepID=UPI003432DC23
MPTCPSGHQSVAEDWCEVCGQRMAGAVPPPPSLPAGFLNAPPGPPTGRPGPPPGPPAPAQGQAGPPPGGPGFGGPGAPDHQGGQGGYGFPPPAPGPDNSGGQGGYGFPPPAPAPGPGGPGTQGGQGGYGFPPPAPGPGPDRAGQSETCPQCGTPREAMAPFCEGCRYNFLTNSPTSYAPPPGQQPGPPPAAPGPQGGYGFPPPAPGPQDGYGFPPPQPQQPQPPQQQGMPGPGGFPDQPGQGGFPDRSGQGGFPGMPGPGGYPGQPGPPPGMPGPGPVGQPGPPPQQGVDDWPLSPPNAQAAPPPMAPAPPGPGPQAPFEQQPPAPFPPHDQSPYEQQQPAPFEQQMPPQQGPDQQWQGGPGTGQGPAAPPQGPQPVVGNGWVVAIAPDREYFMAMMGRSGPEAAGLNLPAYSPEQVLPLANGQIAIGRRRNSTGEAPDIDLGSTPEDPGVSHQHALLVQQQDGSWAVVDQNSTNGTTINLAEDPIQPYVPVPLHEGDRVHVGAWTTLTVRRG